MKENKDKAKQFEAEYNELIQKGNELQSSLQEAMCRMSDIMKTVQKPGIKVMHKKWKVGEIIAVKTLNNVQVNFEEEGVKNIDFELTQNKGITKIIDKRYMCLLEEISDINGNLEVCSQRCNEIYNWFSNNGYRRYNKDRFVPEFNNQTPCRFFDSAGFDVMGLWHGEKQFDLSGYDCDGYNQYGYNKNGYDQDGYNSMGVDINGLCRNGQKQTFYDGINEGNSLRRIKYHSIDYAHNGIFKSEPEYVYFCGYYLPMRIRSRDRYNESCLSEEMYLYKNTDCGSKEFRDITSILEKALIILITQANITGEITLLSAPTHNNRTSSITKSLQITINTLQNMYSNQGIRISYKDILKRKSIIEPSHTSHGNDRPGICDHKKTIECQEVLDPAHTYIIIDDIVTTGATIRACKRKVEEAGVISKNILMLAILHTEYINR